MRDELREMIRNYESHRERPKRITAPKTLAAMQLVFEKERAHYTLEEEAEYLKALDRYTRELCKEENA
ncbi:MAG: hypothetical protein IJ071_10580 [Ruminococcus sp.]|nr:hypothetical protein [Ruminococcus sp.]